MTTVFQRFFEWASGEASEIFTPETLDVLGTTAEDIAKVCAVVGADVAAVNASIASGTAPIWAILSEVLPLLMKGGTPAATTDDPEPEAASGDAA